MEILTCSSQTVFSHNLLSFCKISLRLWSAFIWESFLINLVMIYQRNVFLWAVFLHSTSLTFFGYFSPLETLLETETLFVHALKIPLFQLCEEIFKVTELCASDFYWIFFSFRLSLIFQLRYQFPVFFQAAFQADENPPAQIFPEQLSNLIT